MSPRPVRVMLAAALTAALASPAASAAADPEPVVVDPDDEVRLPAIEIPGLLESVRLYTDAWGVPHVFAANDHDAIFVQGFLHAQDRLFQMDVLRRTFEGTLAELVGAAALPSDVQLRTLGLSRAALATAAVLDDETLAWLDAYTDGVNAFMAQASGAPAEHAALSITLDGIRAWTNLDTLTIAKGLSFGLSFDLEDLDRTEALLSFQAAGSVLGFDGTALFFEDLYRSAPFDPGVSIPKARDALRTVSSAPLPRQLPEYLGSSTLELVRRARASVGQAPSVAAALTRSDAVSGSNWWVASGAVTDSGQPLLANDPHLALDTPATFYEIHLRVRQGVDSPTSVFGVSFPGTPGIIQGCNTWICWGSTVNPLDVTDVYQEQLVVDPIFGPTHSVFEGGTEPLVPIPQTYFVNAMVPGSPDTIVDAGIGVTDPGGLTLVVPRRNDGPIVSLFPDPTDPTRADAFSVAYTGWGATFELAAARRFARARSVDEFREALQSFDVGSQNWAVADREGHIAYFTSAEMPLREDLQTLNLPDGGVPPFVVRDGTHTLRHEWLPLEGEKPGDQALDFAVLPFDEMPQVVDPAAGYIVNCNNDPIGTTLDNDPLNQLRPGGGLYYLSPGYATGFRQGRVTRLFEEALADGGRVGPDDFARFQANHQLLDAEVLVPHLLQAFANAEASVGGSDLAAFAADPRVVEAAGRLAVWDFSTPTGIPEGFDPGDDPENLPEPTADEIADSVAATIYSTWRGQVVRRVIDGTLERIDADTGGTFGLSSLAPGSSLSVAALRNLLDNFPEDQGYGASGQGFFPGPGLRREDDRDANLLQSLVDALDLLASDEFAAAFGGSTDQDDYRWGRLHRIVFDHPLGPPFSIPNGSGLSDLSDELPGLARSGGFGAVDASSHSARADGVNEFMFGSGPNRRVVAETMALGPDMHEVIPGGQSGSPGSPFQTDQLRLWLTNHLKEFPHFPDEVVTAEQDGGTRVLLLPEGGLE